MVALAPNLVILVFSNSEMGSFNQLWSYLLNHSRCLSSRILNPYGRSTCGGVFRLKATVDVNLGQPQFTRNWGGFPAYSMNPFDYIKPEPCGFSHNNLLGQSKSVPGLTIITRGKKSKRRKEHIKDEPESSDDDGEENDWEEEAGSDFKDIKAMVSSLRLDAILKAGLNLSRNKLDTAFYESKIRVNEKKVMKKSKELKEGDEIDIIKEPSSVNPDLLNISRVVILKVGEYSDESDKKPVKLRRYKNLLIKKYADQDKEDL